MILLYLPGPYERIPFAITSSVSRNVPLDGTAPQIIQANAIAAGTTGTPASASCNVCVKNPLKNVGAGSIVAGTSGWFGGGTAIPGFTNCASGVLSAASTGGAAGDGLTSVAPVARLMTLSPRVLFVPSSGLTGRCRKSKPVNGVARTIIF